MKRDINNIVCYNTYIRFGDLPLPCIYDTLCNINDNTDAGYSAYIDLIDYLEYTKHEDDRYKYYI